MTMLSPMCCVSAAGRFSAATSHEQNDAYMAEFDQAYDELEAISLSGK